jgi:hypothetical protein
VCEVKRETPMEISISLASKNYYLPEMRRLLGKFTEMPVDVKLFHLYMMMSTYGAQEEFRNILGSLSVELVKKKI